MRALLALSLILFVSACVTTTSTSETGSAIAPSVTIAPGTTPISKATAVDLFTKLCLRQAPRFAGTPASAAANGFVKNPGTGTYYHSTYDLSVKLILGDCSMVFASTATSIGLQLAFANLETHGPTARFRHAGTYNGSQYYNVRIASN